MLSKVMGWTYHMLTFLGFLNQNQIYKQVFLQKWYINMLFNIKVKILQMRRYKWMENENALILGDIERNMPFYVRWFLCIICGFWHLREWHLCEEVCNRMVHESTGEWWNKITQRSWRWANMFYFNSGLKMIFA